VLALFQSALNGAKTNQGQGAGRATDDGIKLVQTLGQFGQAQDFGAESTGQFFSAL
jgi:hypothetical protein